MTSFEDIATDVIRLKNGQKYTCQEIADYVADNCDSSFDSVEEFITLFYDELDAMDLEDILYAYDDWNQNKQDGVMAEEDDDYPEYTGKRKNVPDRWDEDWNNDIAMTESPEGTWTATITGVAAGTYEFKVRADGQWNIEYPKGQGNNETVTVAKDNTTVTIVYVEDPQGITVTQTVPTAIDRGNAEAEKAPAYNLAGVKANKGLVIKNNKKYILR